MSKVYKVQNIFYHNFMDFSIKNKPTRHYPTGLSAHPYSIYFSTEYSGRFWFFRNIHSTSKPLLFRDACRSILALLNDLYPVRPADNLSYLIHVLIVFRVI